MEQTKICPYCREEILAEAKKCKHCGEWLDGSHSDRHQGKGVPQKNKKKKLHIASTSQSKTSLSFQTSRFCVNTRDYVR